jgi:hypothetical protein
MEFRLLSVGSVAFEFLLHKWQLKRNYRSLPILQSTSPAFVIPAKAGIYLRSINLTQGLEMDPRLRGDDEPLDCASREFCRARKVARK